MARRLFLEADPVLASELEAELGGTNVRSLIDAGLITSTGDTVHPTVHLTPHEELWFAHDLIRLHGESNPDWVLGPGPMTAAFAPFLLPPAAETTLDLGCGAGVLGSVATRTSTTVVATDLNPRAAAFTRFNAELNDLELETGTGDLFEPVSGRRFDRIMSVPAFALAPRPRFQYRDGGTELLERIARGARAHLTDRGVLAMWCNWPEREGRARGEEIDRWFDGAGLDVLALRFYGRRPRTYAGLWLGQEHQGDVPRDALEEWEGYLQEQGIVELGFGLVLATPAATPTPRIETRASPSFGDGVAPMIEALLAARRFVATTDDQTLLGTPLVPAPALERVDVRKPAVRVGEAASGSAGAMGWVAERPRLRLSQGLRFSARVDAVAAELVGLLSPAVTPIGAAERLADGLGFPSNAFDRSLPALLRKLLDLGLVLPSGAVPAPADGTTAPEAPSPAPYDGSESRETR